MLEILKVLGLPEEETLALPDMHESSVMINSLVEHGLFNAKEMTPFSAFLPKHMPQANDL